MKGYFTSQFRRDLSGHPRYEEALVENLVLLFVFCCGLMSGCSARVNPCSVPQREPNYFWFIIAGGLISAVAIWGGIGESLFWFAMKGVGLLLLATAIGASLPWILRKESPMIED